MAANEPAFSCRVFNGTPEHLGVYDVWIEMAGGCSTGTPGMPPGVWTEVTRGGTEKLRLSKDGVLWEGFQGETIQVVNGGQYRLTVDSSCPPLTQDEVKEGNRLIFDVVEGALPLHDGGPPVPAPAARPYGDADQTPDPIWRAVVTSLGRDGSNDKVVDTVKKMLCDATCQLGRTTWNSWYDDHPRRPKVQGDPAAALEALHSGQYAVTVYHRALDRFPGGNADIVIAKQTYTPNAADGPGTMQVVQFRNWDGSSSLSSEPTMHEEAAGTFPAVIEALRALLTESPRRDMAVTILDPAIADSDEYDTKWSSIEVLLEGIDGSLLARLHQRAVLSRDALPEGATGSEGLYGKEASDREQAVLDAVEASLQMGTSVEHWSEELSSGPAWSGPTRDLDWHGYIMPIYLSQ